MNIGGNKPFSFVSGVLLGMLAAIGLVFLLINDFNPFNLVSEKGGNLSNDTIIDLTENKTSRVKKIKKSASFAKIEEEEMSATDSFSIKTDSQTVKFSSNEEDIVVRRDELLETKTIELVFLDAKSKTNKSDSLLKLMENASNTDKTLYKIEFWKSPINYRGFKMIRNNIIAFGLEINELVKLFSFEQQIYLKQGNSVYKLYQTTDFQPFYKVNEESIIKLMR
jgi:hypothetical protein